VTLSKNQSCFPGLNISPEPGQSADGNFDPLEFWVEEAHARGLELHAWINPYRVARQTHDLTSLAASNYARKNPDWVVKHWPGICITSRDPAVRQLIIDGVTEIVENYDVDWHPLDDYFYPDKDFADSDTFKNTARNTAASRIGAAGTPTS
jgi:uncharacterized lipoprotein YddW (UPF0748 family)